MARSLLVWFAVLIAAPLSYADTPIIGFVEQDTVWTRSGSPYVSLGSVVVKEGASLTIDPGVTIKFDSGHGLMIHGMLIARGTPEDRIVFAAKKEEVRPVWEGISFANTSANAEFDEAGNYLRGSILQYCSIEFAAIGVEGKSASPFVDHCLISDSVSEGIIITAPAAKSVSGDAMSGVDVVVIRDSIIVHNGNRGILVEDAGKVALTGNRVEDNGSCGIMLSSCEDISIRENSVVENAGGIRIFASTSAKVTGNTLARNITAMGGGGVSISSITADVVSNKLTENEARGYSGDSSYGGGMYVESVYANIIGNNLTGNVTKCSTEPGGKIGTAIGGGIYANVANANILNNALIENKAQYGGGVYTSGDTANIDSNILTGNEGDIGGGICVASENAILKRNIVIANTASLLEGEGGGLNAKGKGNITISNNTLVRNSARDGGAIKVSYRNIVIRDNIVTGNAVSGRYAAGGGLSVSGSDELVISRNVITDNLSESGTGAAIFLPSALAGQAEISDNLIQSHVSEKQGANTVCLHGNPVVTGNVFADNRTDYVLAYDQPSGSPDLNAANNYWGLSTEAEIRARIHDFFQDNSLALVNVVPFLMENPFPEGHAIQLLSYIHDFGTVAVARDADWSLAISNTKSSVLKVNSIICDNEAFTVISPNLPQNITPGGSLGFTVRFLPTEEKTHISIITVASSDLVRPEVYFAVHGSGVREVAGETIIGHDGATMALIPAGEFERGVRFINGGSSDERSLHTSVYLDAFYIDKYEVTNALYKKFVDANPMWRKDQIDSKYADEDYLKEWTGSDYPSEKADHPVVYISWYAAQAYAIWAGKRLPTEAEWEKAARGGLLGKNYPWGDSISHDDANCMGVGGKDTWLGTSPVGSFAPNGYGLYDMAGNVWEWCDDWYDEDYYSISPPGNPKGPSLGTTRILRGGAWDYMGGYMHCAYRFDSIPTFTHDDVGFRCARDP